MPNLTIDNMAVEVPAGTKVIDAAERLGIMVPRFCYLKVLGAVGACRMCAVHFVDGPVKGVEMSCMIEAQDGMVVSTSDTEAVDFRRQVIEWLMVNHPHDCPVCDEGGQCLLQDETVSGGHGIRRYPGLKRTYRDQYLGPFIQHEMNRCIHCYRCARFYQEYAGYRDFGVLQIGNRIFYGRYEDGALESPFAGNLVDICPTGVFTDKPARYRARRWDMQRAPSVCIHCGIGCNTITSGFHQEIIRQEARENLLINGSFLCDRGRFGIFYANHPERTRQPRLKGSEVDWEAALNEAAKAMQRITAEHGPQALAVLASPRTSLETMFILEESCRRLGNVPLKFFTDRPLENRVRRAAIRLDEHLAVSLAEIEQADFILVLGVDPVNESPLLALALRQAVRKGATVAVIDPRPVSLPLDCTLLPAPPAKLSTISGQLVHQALEGKDTEVLDDESRLFYNTLASENSLRDLSMDESERIVEKITTCKRPVIICGTGIVPGEMPDFAADLAHLLFRVKEQCGLYYVMPGPNAFGTVLFNDNNDPVDFPGLLDAITKREIRGLLVVEADPFHDFCDRQHLEKSLANLDLLVGLDYLPSELSSRAHILCPTTTHFETGSHFVNQEGRLQSAAAVHECGRPLSQVTAGKHPRRDYARPGEEYGPRPAGSIFQELCDRINGHQSVKSDDRDYLQNEIRTRLQQLRLTDTVGGHHPATPIPLKIKSDNETLELILAEQLFGTEELSVYSAPVTAAIKEPLVLMHHEDADRAGLDSGDMVTLHLDRGVLRLRLATTAEMAQGCLIVPRHRDLNWQQVKSGQELLPLCRIEKE
jgi:NADH-quinone oxidoreductase subunit G